MTNDDPMAAEFADDPTKKVEGCSLAKVLGATSPTGGARLQAWLDSGAASSEIHRKLRKVGVRVALDVVKDHRATPQRCKCTELEAV